MHSYFVSLIMNKIIKKVAPYVSVLSCVAVSCFFGRKRDDGWVLNPASSTVDLWVPLSFFVVPRWHPNHLWVPQSFFVVPGWHPNHCIEPLGVRVNPFALEAETRRAFKLQKLSGVWQVRQEKQKNRLRHNIKFLYRHLQVGWTIVYLWLALFGFLLQAPFSENSTFGCPARPRLKIQPKSCRH